MSNKKSDIFKRLTELPSLVYVIMAVLFFAVHVILCTYTKISVAACALALVIIYVVASAAIHIAVQRRMSLFRIATDASEEQNNGVIYTFRQLLKEPYAVVNDKGKIVTVNSAMRNAAGAAATVFNADISEICDIPFDYLIKHVNDSAVEDISEDEQEEIELLKDKKALCTVNGRDYRTECYTLHSKGKLFYLIMFNDVTELRALSVRHRAEHLCVAYIVIDNLDEIAQYAQASYQAEATQVDAILKEWAKSLGGILREYERYKYILLFTRQNMLSCATGKFEILDRVREIRLGEDNMPITVSIGVTTLGDTFSEREHEALVCLEMALQRGGDQAVMKNEAGTFFFGGRTKSQQKKSGGHSRVISTKLCSMIQSASNVIIMGHSNPDFDSVGACVGIATLALHLGVHAKIVTDINSESFTACTGRLCELADYRDIFVDGVTGLGEIEFGTLLVIVDANNFKILEAPEIAEKSFKTVVIDHHIKKEEFEQEPQLVYIDPSASSASELVSEILEFSVPVGTLRKEEANVLMAGIMVDTQNFTRTVGTRTFSAALYLRGAGASPEYARTFFEQKFEDYHSEALFGMGAEIVYNGEIAITVSEGTGSPHDRVTAAKAADKLLAVRDVNAAFALVKIGSTVHISGRSNGKINVQLILEKIGGGGHFDVAGAAIRESELGEAKNLLVGAIDAYMNDTNK